MKTVDAVYSSEIDELMEQICDGVIEVTCPECGEGNSVEMDADYCYECSCGVSVRCKDIISLF